MAQRNPGLYLSDYPAFAALQPGYALSHLTINSYRNIQQTSGPSKGAVMRRSDGGIGCGARGRASQARTRAATGHRWGPLWVAAGSQLTVIGRPVFAPMRLHAKV